MQMVPEAGGGSVGWLSARPDRPLRPFHGLDCPQRGTPTDPDPKYRGWDDPVPAPAVPGTRAWIFRGPPVALHIPRSSIVSLPVSRVSLHPRRLLPALVLKFRPSGRRAGQGRWRPTGKGEVEVDPARNGADRRRCRPGRQIWRRTSAADSRTPAAGG